MKYVKLGDICSKGVSSLRQKDTLPVGDYPVYGASGICGYLSDYQHNEPYVAVVKDGAGVGRVQLCSGKSSVLGTLQALLPKEEVNCEYLYEVVRSLNLGDGFTGSTIPHIYFKDYKNRTVVIYEKEQQTKITVLFSAVKNVIELHKLAISTCDKLVKSRFMEMFGDPVEGCDWNRMRLDDLCSKLGSGATPRGGKAAYKNEGVPLIRSMNVYNGYFSWKELAYIDDNQAKKLNGVTLRKGDVLLNITGASVARSCVLPSELAGGRVNQHVAIIRADQEKILPVFLNAIFVSESYQHFLLNGSKMAGATREAITKQDLKEMTVPIPPLELQKKFVAFSRQVDKLKFETQQSIEKLQMLYDSLAQDYFAPEGD